jgi:hypothetical protein
MAAATIMKDNKNFDDNDNDNDDDDDNDNDNANRRLIEVIETGSAFANR